MSSLRVKNFVHSRFFEIPKYQRSYAWEKRHVRELFEDILESVETQTSHYIGTFVLAEHSGGDDYYYVVDGQQRLTTIMLIINEIIKHLPEDDAKYYRRFFIADPTGNGPRYRLNTLGKDNKYLINLLRGVVDEPENKGQRLLQGAYEEVKTNLSNIENKSQLLDAISNLETMQFIEESEGDAIRIFQTVNDRGKPLTNMEKAKSLLIYFSNRYLGKRLDDKVNRLFGEIFELYDDIKHVGEKQGIGLIASRDFDEDNIMRYHFVSYSNDNYDATAKYVLSYLKRNLSSLRNTGKQDGYVEMERFINKYVENLFMFYDALKTIIEKTLSSDRYYQFFSILGPSATLYPLLVKLQILGKLDSLLPLDLPSNLKRKETFLDLLEIIDVRIYKTRGTDPRAQVSRFATRVDESRSDESIQLWLQDYNKQWMSKGYFHSLLRGSIYGNQALSHMFIDYCEYLDDKEYDLYYLKKLKEKRPTIEHILSQTPTFTPEAMGFDDDDEFLEFQHTLGNLTLLERRLNPSAANKDPVDKVEVYDRSLYKITNVTSSRIAMDNAFTKDHIIERGKKISEYLVQRWWC